MSTTNKKVYTEEEDRFILVMLDRFGIDGDGIHERIRDEIRESPLFRFDWFFLSRTPQEIGRRCATLLTTVAKEFENNDGKMTNGNGFKGRPRDEDEEEIEEVEAPAKKKAKGTAKVRSFSNGGPTCNLLTNLDRRTNSSRTSRTAVRLRRRLRLPELPV